MFATKGLSRANISDFFVNSRSSNPVNGNVNTSTPAKSDNNKNTSIFFQDPENHETESDILFRFRLNVLALRSLVPLSRPGVVGIGVFLDEVKAIQKSAKRE
jgi:hypothetical protein